MKRILKGSKTTSFEVVNTGHLIIVQENESVSLDYNQISSLLEFVSDKQTALMDAWNSGVQHETEA
jgi:hypothetical protein